METIFIRPNTKAEATALKTIFKGMKIQFEDAKTEENPYNSALEGICKPEGLKYHHFGKWSRRINEEHRIIYEVEEGMIFIWSLRGHYEK
jgi:toxin YoeB